MSLPGIPFVQIPHKLLVFFFFFCPVVMAVDAACGGGGNLNLTNCLMITSEEALLPCVQQWARRSSRSELSLNRHNTEFVFSAVALPHLIRPYSNHGGVSQCPSGFWRWTSKGHTAEEQPSNQSFIHPSSFNTN